MKLKVILLALLFPSAVWAFQDCSVGSSHFTVGTTAVQVLGLRDVYQGRARWIINNTGTVDAYCAIGSPDGNSSLTAPNGMLIVANGGNWTESAPLSYGVIRYLPEAAMWCVTATGSTTIVTCDY